MDQVRLERGDAWHCSGRNRQSSGGGPEQLEQLLQDSDDDTLPDDVLQTHEPAPADDVNADEIVNRQAALDFLMECADFQ
ncbi:hypothetical protein ON010_g10234 [Phytophthora cinnamomi]|nr:hypothetical protein ON010_g10234 [Phytophthora cinnamomi]